MDDGHLQLYVIDEDGEIPHQITPDGLYASVPAWSPDDTHVVFIGSSHTIIVLDLASGEMSEISVPEATRNFLPRFSSNNTLTVSATRNLIPNVYEIDLSGRILRNLTPDLNVGAYSLWRSSEQ
jgi:Tol biopolymer transport system component